MRDKILDSEQNPEREINFNIPFVFNFSYSDYTLGQRILTIRFLCFSFLIGTLCGLGWSWYPYFERWQLRMPLHMSRVLIVFSIGIDKGNYLFWQLKRIKKRMTSKQVKKFRQTLK